ncbi:MAG: methyltransferase domain-containing protein [Actinomycetota bacterium]|nr:methyltransferase domain-containing protein [Actinomycetota bacterium]
MPTSPPLGRYLHGHHDSVLRSHRWRTVENSAAYLLPKLRIDATVLDAGCGPGTISAGLAERVPEGSVVAIDTAEGIVTASAVQAAAEGQANLRFAVGDVYRLDFGDASFDVVHAHQVLQHLSDPVAALVEMRRVCRPGGVVAARDGDFGAMFWYPSSDVMSEWRDLYCAVARSTGGEPEAGRHLASWARSAGFSEIETSVSAWCFATTEERLWWGNLWAERITASRFAEQAIGARLAQRADLDRLAGGWRRWIADEDGMFAVVHGEILCSV